MVRKVPRPAVHTEQVARVPETAKCVVSATLLTNLKTVQRLAKNAINVVLRNISARVADHHGTMDKTHTDTEVEHQDAVGALRDAADPAEAGIPGPDHDPGAVHVLEMPTALKSIGMILMTLTC